MLVLICSDITTENEYIKYLSEEYHRKNCQLVFGVENFFNDKLKLDIVHIQWPESLYRWRFKLPQTQETFDRIEERLLQIKANKSAIVYTVHNLKPHIRPTKFDSQIYDLISKYSDLFVHHGHNSIELYKENYPSSIHSKHIYAPHGPYLASDKNFDYKKIKQDYRLDLDKYVFLNFGKQRSQKGGEFLSSIFKKWNQSQSQLFTIGPLSNELKTSNTFITYFNKLKSRHVLPYINDKVTLFNKHERIINRKVPNDEVGRIMSVSDVLILGHQSGLNSGLIALGASYSKGIVFPDIGNFREQLIGYPLFECYEVGDINSAVKALNRIQTRIEDFSPGSINIDNSKWKEHHDWGIHVKAILENI